MRSDRAKIFFAAQLAAYVASHIVTQAGLNWGIQTASAQQLSIDRVNQMPNMPAPYVMRDWRQVAIGYDQFVFDFSKSGTYLPLGWKYSATVNYPAHGSFGLDTVVGTPRQNSSEAINVLPALVGASIVGIDKSNQNGENWVLMAEEFFNRRPEENVYLNGPVTESGDDWWYETMPNVFFYQLNDLYPGTGDFDFQFTSVADQWRTAVARMGGSASPWNVPNMNYRAWSLSTMKGLISGVKEPEAAGAIAWILYNAYVESGRDEYRIGAELALEYLNGLSTNPSYELQLPYGVYAAARMNAELGTDYDVQKLINWCFDVGPLRSWGTLLGTWGGRDVHGLVGEDSSNDYAFMMNGFQQAGALVPLVRYDDRFARAIGKWVLNLANASRLFYANYLPPANQDSKAWSDAYDPEAVIGHEALRQTQSNASPYATGDAIAGGWGFTNLALYGSSHVGMLGGILDTTDVAGVLKLDALKTDFYGGEAFPSFLYFNPFLVDTAVTVDLSASAPGSVDLYDAVTNQFVAFGVSGSANVTLRADAAALLVQTPSAGAITYELDRTLVNGTVVDFNSGQLPANYPPRIKALEASSELVFLQDSTTVYCTGADRDDTSLSFFWSATGGTFAGDDISGENARATWMAPAAAGTFAVSCRVEDGRGGVASDSLSLTVFANHRPAIDSLAANPPIVDVGESSLLGCYTTDVDGDDLAFGWFASGGSLTDESGTGEPQEATAVWTAPGVVGYFSVSCTVDDSAGGVVSDSVGLVAGRLVADLEFAGNLLDDSGFGNHAVALGGPLQVADRDGNPANAFVFDGVDDALVIPWHPSFDFVGEITVSFWMKPAARLNRESFLVSHGSWQNRWKVSVIPDQFVRWTIRTDAGVKDIDSTTPVVVDSVYHIATTYKSGIIEVFVNGALDAQSTWTGRLLTTGIDLTIAQMLPGDTQYNFAGVIDDVRIYNRALPPDDIFALFTLATDVDDEPFGVPSSVYTLGVNYPNPFSGVTTIPYTNGRSGAVTIRIFDVSGRHVRTLLDVDGVDADVTGHKTVSWNGLDSAGRQLPSGVYFIRMQTPDGVFYRKATRIRTQ